MRFECVPGYCPCGAQCYNRQLQLGSALETAIVDCGRKGVGVIILEGVDAGRFVGEYVVKVISAREAKLRCLVRVRKAHCLLHGAYRISDRCT